jgi:tripartite-type tricarboxylate transporter receptor subunit TctC
VRTRFAQQGAEAIYMSLDQSKKFIGDEIVKYHDIITKAGVSQID